MAKERQEEEKDLRELKNRVREHQDLTSAMRVLNWDATTRMPAGGAEARGRHLGTLQRIRQEKFYDASTGVLLEGLRGLEHDRPRGNGDAALVRLSRQRYERLARVPGEFVEEFVQNKTAAYAGWIQAREQGDFEILAPHLERTVEVSRRFSDLFVGEREHVADPLIAESDYGTKTSTLRKLFGELRRELVPLVHELVDRTAGFDDSFMRTNGQNGLIQKCDTEAQQLFMREVVGQLGFDFSRGQLEPGKPMMMAFSIEDVRLLIGSDQNDLSTSIFSGLHEAGHALYEQGLPREYEGTFLSEVPDGIHESQARLFENMVGRSKQFWEYFLPKLKESLPSSLSSVGVQDFHRAINRVEPGPVRTAADEVTYNLHVVMRFEVEVELLEGSIDPRDLPEVWRERCREYLGIEVGDDLQGVLQDPHWYLSGFVGGRFQMYTIGNLVAAQLYRAALEDHPEIVEEMSYGEFGTLLRWLTDRVYSHGAKYDADELLEQVTGAPMSVAPFVEYLREKYTHI